MQGILPSQYKLLNEYLNNALIENNNSLYKLTDDENIVDHKKKLDEIYKNYQKSILNMADLIKQFEHHKNSIRKLLVLQKKNKKKFLKSQNNKQSKIKLSTNELDLTELNYTIDKY